MSLFFVTGEQVIWYEFEIEASTKSEAMVLARSIIEEGTAPSDMKSFYSNEPGEIDLEAGHI